MEAYRFRSSEDTASWRAHLAVELEPSEGKTRVRHVTHRGPLRIQRAFYPERDGTSHVYLLHPPGGVVGGDELCVRLSARAGAECLFTTPSAMKLYRSAGPTAQIFQELHVAREATMEWLPQETIVFSGARAEVTTRVTLEPGARFFGWELTCLGRPAAGEDYATGQLTQRVELWQDELPVYIDRLQIDARARMTRAAWGLGGRATSGTLLIAGATTKLLSVVRECLLVERASGKFAATDLDGALLVRYLGSSVPECWATFRLVWEAVRPLFKGTSPSPPRIWAV